MRRLLWSVGMLVVCGCAAGQKAAVDTPEVWMCHRAAPALGQEGAQWDFVKANLDGCKLYIGAVRKCPPQKLADLLKVLKDNDIKVSLELGATLGHIKVDDNNGLNSARRELKAVDKIVAAGGRVDYLDMDGPVSRTLYSGRHRFDFDKKWDWQGFRSIEPCVDQLMVYMQTVREQYPDIEFFTLTNFPNWGYKGQVSYHGRYENQQDWGDYFEVIKAIISKSREADVPIRGVTVDNPYDYAIAEVPSAKLDDPGKIDWIGRVRDLEEYVESQGLEFNLIINSQRGGSKSAQVFYTETLEFLEAYRARGGTPKRYMVQSWYRQPSEIVPETAPYTMTALVKEVIKRVKHVGDE